LWKLQPHDDVEVFEINNLNDLDSVSWQGKIDWEMLKNYYDGVHLTDTLFSMAQNDWDKWTEINSFSKESTLWFDWHFKNVEKI
jgi:hypothetical protein